MFLIVWEFRARPEVQSAFEEAYGSAGAWAKLFRNSPGFRGTVLAQDVAEPVRYLVSDTWDAEASFLRFQEAFASEYEALDRECAALTEREIRIGAFRVAG